MPPKASKLDSPVPVPEESKLSKKGNINLDKPLHVPSVHQAPTCTEMTLPPPKESDNAVRSGYIANSMAQSASAGNAWKPTPATASLPSEPPKTPRASEKRRTTSVAHRDASPTKKSKSSAPIALNLGLQKPKTIPRSASHHPTEANLGNDEAFTQGSGTQSSNFSQQRHIQQDAPHQNAYNLSKFHSLRYELDSITREKIDDDVEPGQLLSIEQVTRAIAAVTEALNEKLGRKKFGVVSSTTIQAAKKQPPLEGSRAIRPRSFLMFPWFYNPMDLSDCSKMTNAEFAAASRKAEKQCHIFLVRVNYDQGLLRLPQLSFSDSCPEFFHTDPKRWRLVKSQIRRTVTNFGIAGIPMLGYDRPVSGVGVPFEPEVVMHVARQENGWSCGLHTILNAWTEALDLQINPDCRMNEAKYKLAVEVINRALDGRATATMICKLFALIGYVFGPRAGGNVIDFGRCIKLSTDHIHEGHRNLDSIINTERDAEDAKLNDLIKTMQYEELGLANADQLITEDNEGQQYMDPTGGDCISPSALSHFLLEYEDQAAVQSMKEIWNVLVEENKINENKSASEQSMQNFRKRFVELIRDENHEETDSLVLQELFNSTIQDFMDPDHGGNQEGGEEKKW